MMAQRFHQSGLHQVLSLQNIPAVVVSDVFVIIKCEQILNTALAQWSWPIGFLVYAVKAKFHF